MQAQIPESAKHPRSVQQMITAVETLRQAETVQTLPYLAQIERQATGWVRIVLFLAVRAGITAALFVAAFLVTTQALRIVLHYGQALTLIVHPGWVRPAWFLMLLGGGLLLARSAAVREMISRDDLWPEPSPPRALRILLQLVDGLAKGLAVAFLLSFALLWLLPMALFLLEASQRMPEWYYQRDLFLDLLRPMWRLNLTLGILLVLIIYGISQRQNRAGLVQTIIVALVLAGFGALFVVTARDDGWLLFDGVFWQAPALPLPEPAFEYYVQFAAWAADPLAPLTMIPAVVAALGLLVLALVYPLGIATGLVSPLRWPFLSFRNTLYWFWLRVRLRWGARRAIHDQARRNRGQVAGDPWATVCRQHLLRFETKFERRAYRRRLPYHHCPICNDDNAVYNGVECMTLTLDRARESGPEQAGPALLLNGIDWLEKGSKEAPPVFDAIVIGRVEPYDIERFVVQYREYGASNPSAYHKPLKQVTARISHDSNARPEHERRLVTNGAKVCRDYDLARQPDPCLDKVRTRFVRQQRSKQVLRLAWRGALVALLLLLCGILYVRLPTIVEAVSGWQKEVWPTVQHSFDEQTAASRRPTRTPRPPATSRVPEAATETAGEGGSPSREPSTATPAPEHISSAPADGAELVYVPAGVFTMGSDLGNSELGTGDEFPAHEVDLSAYYIDAYEVTNERYERCVQAGACDVPQSTFSNRSGRYYGNEQYADYPVIKVTWHNAADYCAWAGRRLPTEAEWEKAARWSPDEGSQRRYPWGSGLPSAELLNFAFQVNDTAPVGDYPAGRSPLGVYDMAGNVWEWVNDWYDSAYYQQSPDENPTGPETGLYKILRGGAWGNADYDVTVTGRFPAAPLDSRFDAGFRCALDEPG